MAKLQVRPTGITKPMVAKPKNVITKETSKVDKDSLPTGSDDVSPNNLTSQPVDVSLSKGILFKRFIQLLIKTIKSMMVFVLIVPVFITSYLWRLFHNVLKVFVLIVSRIFDMIMIILKMMFMGSSYILNRIIRLQIWMEGKLYSSSTRETKE